jgi:uncharacterized protein
MKTVAAIFWNMDQNRLQAGWRLLIHFIVFFSLLLGHAALTYYFKPMPLSTIPINLLYLAGGLGMTWLIARHIDHRSFVDLGFHFNRTWWLDLGFGLVLGIILVTGVFLSMKMLGWLVITGPAGTNTGLPIALAFFLRVVWAIVVAINEELAFRGYQLKNLAEGFAGRRTSPRGAIVLALVVSSSLFGLMHLINGTATLASTLTTICGGLLLSLPYILTGELGAPIGFHLTWNLFVGPVFGFAVSGAVQSTHLLTVDVIGPSVWTGGSYGPEVGLLSLVWMLVGFGLIIAWNKWRRGKIELRIPLTRYTPRSTRTMPVLENKVG